MVELIVVFVAALAVTANSQLLPLKTLNPVLPTCPCEQLVIPPLPLAPVTTPYLPPLIPAPELVLPSPLLPSPLLPSTLLPTPLLNPFLPAASPVSAIANSFLPLPPASPCNCGCQYLRKIPIPPPSI